MTTDEPARIWTSNWSTAQIDKFCCSISSLPLQGMKMTELEKIIRPLEVILANGASGLWRCKQVHEHLLQKTQHSPTKPKTMAHTSPGPSSQTASTTPRPLPRKRLKVTPLLTTGSTSAVYALVFPSLLPKQEKRLLAARMTAKTTTVISNIDNVYKIAGAMIQRLCGNAHRFGNAWLIMCFKFKANAFAVYNNKQIQLSFLMGCPKITLFIAQI